MPFDTTTSQDISEVEAYVCSDAGAAVARAVVEATGGTGASLHGGGLSGAARLSADTPLARTVLAEIGNIPVDMACECVAELCKSGTQVVVLGDQTDIATYRALLQAGAAEYFSFPVDPADILAVQPKRATAVVAVEPPKPAAATLSVAVTGSNGGVGASLLAQNLAFHAAAPKSNNLRTALIDADLQFGSLAIDMDRDETVGLLDALMAPDRVDDTFVAATMDHLGDRLSMYSHQVRAGQNALNFESGIAGLLPPLRDAFDAVVTDLPRDVLMRHAGIAEHLDALVLVVPAGFSGVNAATRLIDRIATCNPDLTILPVLSELRRDAGLSRKDIEKTIGRRITAVLPRCDTQIVRAQRHARPLVDAQPRGPYAKAVKSLWAQVSSNRATAEAPAKRPLIKRIFG